MKEQNPSPQIFPVYVDGVEVGVVEIPSYWLIGVVLGVFAIVIATIVLMRR